MSHRLTATAATFLLLSLVDLTLAATWPLDGAAISVPTGSNQFYSQVTTDGAGGAIIAWWDLRTPSSHIYLQRIDGFGNSLWATDGIPVCPSSNYQYSNFAIISDNAGGAIVTWEDARISGYDVYAQRVNPDGNLLWSPAGVVVCNSSGNQRTPQASPDGSGGAYIVWQDERNANKDIYAQRIDANGNLLWATGGVAVCTFSADQESPEIAADVQGAYIIWKDMRAGNYDIYATRVNPDGTISWLPNGSVVCTATGTQDQAQVIPNGFGGLLAVWHDLRVATGDIYFQLLNAGGNYQFTVNGVVVSTTSGDKTNPQIVSDGVTAGAIIAWRGFPAGGWDIYAQRMKSGTPAWGVGGVVVCSVPYNEDQLQLISDGTGGAIAAWADSRLGWEYNIFAQRLDANGAAQWTANGVALCEAANGQYAPQLASDGARGAIVAWQDYRSFSNYDVYAQRVDQNGYWGYPSADIRSVRDVPGDQGGKVNVAWHASRLDPLPYGSISKYSVWRAMPTAQAQLAIQRGASMLASVADLDLAATLTGPVLREQRLAGVTYFWEMVASVDAYYLDAYAKVVPTLFDSTATVDDPQYFQVIAHTTNSKVFWISAPASGRSIDNLAPAAPAGLAGAQVFTPAGLRLIWNANHEADLSHYAVYRGSSANFVPGASNLVAELPDTVLTDSGWCHCGTDYYKVAALDIHGNVSVFALLTPQAVTGVDSPNLPTRTYLAQNVPNPFNPTTRISFGLKKPGDVSLRIYDPAGRLVRMLFAGARPAGVYEETWDGRDNAGRAVASGVYFYQLQAGTFVQTRKMVLLK